MATDSTMTRQPVNRDLFEEVTGSTLEEARQEHFVKYEGQLVAILSPAEDGARVDLSPNEELSFPIWGIELAYQWAHKKSFVTSKTKEAARIFVHFLADPDVRKIDQVAEQLKGEGVDEATEELEWWANAISQSEGQAITAEDFKREKRAARKYEAQAAPSASPGVCPHTGVELPPGGKVGTRRGAKGRMRKYDYRTGNSHDIVVETYHDGEIYLTNKRAGVTRYWKGEKQGDLWDEVFKAARRMANAIKAQ